MSQFEHEDETHSPALNKLIRESSHGRDADELRRAEEEMLRAAGRYLNLKGWSALVISASHIQGGPHNFELVFRFTGGKAPAPSVSGKGKRTPK